MAAPPPVDISPAIAAAESLLADLRAFEAGQAAMPPGAHNALLRKAHALRRAIETPYDVVGHFVESAVLYGALWTLVGLGAMDALPDPAATNGVNGHAAPPGISAEELAALLQRTKGARVDASIIGRALRAAAGQEIGTELAPGRFAHNARSRAFTLAPPGIGGFMRVSLDFAGTAVRIPEWVAAHQGAGQEEYFLDRRKSPFAWTRGKEGRTYYECIDEDESYRELFYITMDSTEKMLPVKGMFPFAELRGAVEEAKGKEGEEERPFVIDVGGGFGRALVAIGEEVAEWRDEVKPRMVLQELQVVVERLGKDDLPGVERMVHDMFTPQPLKNAHVYFFRRVLHNYYNPVCAEILRNTVSAMGPDSRVVVCDLVVPESVDVGGPTDVWWIDFSMGCIGGKEKSMKDFEEIFDAAGLEIVKVYPSGFSPMAMVEGRLKTK